MEYPVLKFPNNHVTIFVVIICLIGLYFPHFPTHAGEVDNKTLHYFDQQIKDHPGENAAYVLEQGEEALIARAWLTDNAKKSIEVQYFIWSTDNIGILASEALLRAAERGVKVRVIVDDINIDAPDKSLLALSKHPNIAIKIYNPKHSVGTPAHKRLLNLVTDFRGFNQRMHDKTFIVDGNVLITGGRNMADEYFDYNHEYNFRDRDVLVLGNAASDAQKSFNRFWGHPLSVPVEELYDGFGILQKNVKVSDQEIQDVYQSIREYASDAENYSPEVRLAISNIPQQFPELAKALVWGDIEFISDKPGKNDNTFRLGGGGQITLRLAELLSEAEDHILIQSPYLVLTDETKDLFKSLIAKGVSISISTNSLTSTDNIYAFSGYRTQRKKLLKMGLEIFEYKDSPDIQKTLIARYPDLERNNPIFAIHAKTLVIDSKTLYIGTFNLDPRSVNLNTEVGVVINNTRLAKQVASSIEADMAPENSWNAATDHPDQYSSWLKRSRITFWRLMPIKPLL